MQIPPPAGDVGATVLGPPKTAADVRALRIRRGELSDQLISATNRRDELVSELKSAPSGTEQGLQARIGVLDQRILQLESDIAATGRLLTNAPSAALVASTAPPFMPNSGPDWSAGAMAAMFIVLIPLVFVLARLIWKRGSAQKHVVNSTVGKDVADRMGRMEQAVDAIALEVERISEGQRFLTKIMTDRSVAGAAAERAPALRGGERVAGSPGADS